MQRATAGEQYQGQREDLAAISADMADTREQQQQEWDVPDFPVINALLPPDNRRGCSCQRTYSVFDDEH